MERISDFDIGKELGRGGMGIVYLATERPIGRQVALKVLDRQFARLPDIARRFEKEAASIAKLSHESIIRIYRYGNDDDNYFLALEYIDGAPLSDILARESLSAGRTIEVLKEVAAALGCAHSAGIVHRDVKPSNVFVRRNGKAVLGDFGIAKDTDPLSPVLTQKGMIIGTPAYMSPEQVRGEMVSPASDVYSLGVMSFEMLTGRPPFTADSVIVLLNKHLTDQPPSIDALAPGLPSSLAGLTMRMLEKDPRKRLVDGNEVFEELAAIEKEQEFPHNRFPADGFATTLPYLSGSSFHAAEVTLASFELAAFSKDTCSKLPPARVAFLLESWYRLVLRAVTGSGGLVDRLVADRVTTIFGLTPGPIDQVQQALNAAKNLTRALVEFNKAHGLRLRMRAGIAHGQALVGHVLGDVAGTSVQGALPAEMKALSKTKIVESPIRLNASAYSRVNDSQIAMPFVDPAAGQAWALEAETP
jgi:serine/threonine protein kinase